MSEALDAGNVPAIDPDDEIVRFQIVKEFTFTDASGKRELMRVGTHERPRRIAEHWFVKAHSDKPPPRLVPQPGTPEYRDHILALKAAREKALAEADLLLAEADQAEKTATAERDASVLAATAEAERLAVRPRSR